MKNEFTEARIRAVMARNKAGFSKKLGQNFLADPEAIQEIVEGAGITEKDHVLEIGPGIGVLTLACAEQVGWVTAVEIDRKLIPILEQTLTGLDNIDILQADILDVDIGALQEKVQKEHPDIETLKVVGNLPYYITTPIIMKLLEEDIPAESITIMMQKEVAERLTASPGTKAYGSITLAVQYYCTLETIAQVPAESFVPKPKVDSTVLRLDLRKEKPVDLIDEKLFFEVVRAGFSMRRKTLLNCLTGVKGMSKDEMNGFLEGLGISPQRRAETLSMEEFATIANALGE